MGISRDSRHKRSASGAKRAYYRKKRAFEAGRQGANTRIGPKRVHTVRTRGGNHKYRALRLDSGNFAWGSEGLTRKTRVIAVAYHPSNNELVRTNTLTKSAVVQVDAAPFRQWYEAHYGQAIGRRRQKAQAAKEGKTEEEVKKSNAVEKKQAARMSAGGKVESAIEKQFEAGRLYAVVSSRPGQSGRVDGYILEGEELAFYQRKLHNPLAVEGLVLRVDLRRTLGLDQLLFQLTQFLLQSLVLLVDMHIAFHQIITLEFPSLFEIHRLLLDDDLQLADLTSHTIILVLELLIFDLESILQKATLAGILVNVHIKELILQVSGELLHVRQSQEDAGILLHQDDAKAQDRRQALGEDQIINTKNQLKGKSVGKEGQKPLGSVKVRRNALSVEMAVECWLKVFQKAFKLIEVHVQPGHILDEEISQLVVYRHNEEIHALGISNAFVEQSICFADAKQTLLKPGSSCVLRIAGASTKITTDRLFKLLQ
ncbi:hypothetical protein HG531_002138 [Fusarium graminearum]|nr:hypothetical protein HG531_002138 [Fusarium graminearum]